MDTYRGKERRSHARVATRISAKILFQTGELSVLILDISMGGAKMSYDPSMSNLPSSFILRCPEFGSVRAELKWRRHGQMGVQFVDANLQKTRLAALLASLN